MSARRRAARAVLAVGIALGAARAGAAPGVHEVRPGENLAEGPVRLRLHEHDDCAAKENPEHPDVDNHHLSPYP